MMELAVLSHQPLSELSTLSAEQISTLIDVVRKYNGQ
jgi:hypothetical protein